MDHPLPPPRGSFVRLALIIACAGAVLFIAGSAWMAWRLTSPPVRPVGPPPADLPAPVEAVLFPAQDDLSLAGWFLPCPGAARAAVLLHGSGRNRLSVLVHARLLHDRGYAVLLYDARGHGESAPAPCSFGWNETQDLLGALDYLRGRGFHSFGLLGMSQGGITIALAADRLRDLGWVVLECTPANAMAVFEHDARRNTGMPGWLAFAGVLQAMEWRLGVNFRAYRPVDTVAQFHCPVFIIAGERDDRVWPVDARAVFEHAHEPKSWWLIPGAPHTNFALFPTHGEYERRLRAFLASAEAPTR